MPHTSSSSIYRLIILQGWDTTDHVGREEEKKEKSKTDFPKRRREKKSKLCKALKPFWLLQSFNLWGRFRQNLICFDILCWGLWGFSPTRSLVARRGEDSARGWWWTTRFESRIAARSTYEALNLRALFKAANGAGEAERKSGGRRGRDGGGAGDGGRDGAGSASINMSKWRDHNFKGRQKESFFAFCSANLKVNPDLPGRVHQAPPPTECLMWCQKKKKKKKGICPRQGRYKYCCCLSVVIICKYLPRGGKNKIGKLTVTKGQKNIEWTVRQKESVTMFPLVAVAIVSLLNQWISIVSTVKATPLQTYDDWVR